MKKIKGYRLGYPKTHRARNLLYLAPNKVEALRWGQYWKLHHEGKKTLPLYYIECIGENVTKELHKDMAAPKEIIVRNFKILTIRKVKEVSLLDCQKVYKRKVTPFLLANNSKVRNGVYFCVVVEDIKYLFLYNENREKAQAVFSVPKNVKVISIHCPVWVWDRYKAGDFNFKNLLKFSKEEI